MTQIVETEQEVTHATGLPVLGSIPIAEQPEPVVKGSREELPVLFGANDGLHSRRPMLAGRSDGARLSEPQPPLKTLLIRPRRS